MPVSEKPQLSVKMPSKIQPTNSTFFAPMRSAMAPAISRIEPEVKPYTLEGHKYKDRGRSMSFAMTGRPTVITPFVKDVLARLAYQPQPQVGVSNPDCEMED
jgi:hypothetical protein